MKVRNLKETLKAVFSALVITMVILLGATSCSSDDSNCMTEAFKVKVESTSVKSESNRNASYPCSIVVNMQDYQNQSLIELDAQGGTICINGGYNMNSNVTILVINGNLKLSGSGNLGGEIIVTDGDIVLDGAYNLNSGFKTSSNSFIFHGSGIINCGVEILVYQAYDFTGSFVWNCDLDDVVTVDGTLSGDGNVGYEVVTVPCDYLGKTIDGYKYLSR